jgi:hypothetical protein
MESDVGVSPLDALGSDQLETNVQKLLYAWMLHEIKSPLTTLLMQLHLVQARAQEPQSSLNGVRQCQAEARRLKDLVFQLESLLLEPFQNAKESAHPLKVQIDRFFSFIFMQLQESPYRYPITISLPRERIETQALQPLVGTRVLSRLMELFQFSSRNGINPCRVLFEQRSLKVCMILQFEEPQFLEHLSSIETDWKGSGLIVSVNQGRVECEPVSLLWPSAQNGS